MQNGENSADAQRRALLGAISSIAVAGCAGSTTLSGTSAPRRPGGDREAEVTPGEDLMQEHGVLERLLLIYDEAATRLEGGRAFDVSPVTRAAGIVRRFVEDYHEKLEEELVFPRLEQADRELALITTLKAQHVRGRQLTDAIRKSARATGGADLARTLRAFSRMYRPHASREETVLLPAFRTTFDAEGYRELGERFEEREHQLFGESGFEDVVAQIAEIEVALGIHDLARFTAP